MSFQNFYYLNEAKFSESPSRIRELDLPMFTVYIDKIIYEKSPNNRLHVEMAKDLLTKAFAEARKQITKMGFPSMHANVVFEDYTDKKGTTQGYAQGNPRRTITKTNQLSKFMSLNIRLIYGILQDESHYMQPLISTIVHEWAHLWMFNYGKRLSDAVRRLYDNIQNSQEESLARHLKNKTTFHSAVDQLISNIIHHGNERIARNKSADMQKISMMIFTLLRRPFKIPAFQTDDLIREIVNELNAIIKSQNSPLMKNHLWSSYMDQLDLYTILDNIYTTVLQFDTKTWNAALSDIVQWSRGYGMKNMDELWATGVQDFVKLPREHQKRILNLMSGTY